MIRLTKPSIEEDDLHTVQVVLSSGFLTQGKKVQEFEDVVASYLGRKYAVAVSNCTSALHLALLSLNIHYNDLILVTNYSWVATANVIEHCGAQPVFVDIRPDTFNMDPDSLKRKLKQLMSHPVLADRVKAIIPVHTFGQIAEMPEIKEIADKYNLPIIEDSACSLGATLHGKKSGSWGIMSCYSFHPRKAITTGEGGIITTDDKNKAFLLRALRNHGLNPESSDPIFLYPGYNYRMTEFQAAMGISQLKKIDRIVNKRRELASFYSELFSNTKIQAPIEIKGGNSVFQSYVVLLPRENASTRHLIIKKMRDLDIETTIGTVHIPLTNYYQLRYGYKIGDFPVADDIACRSLTLPLYEDLSNREQEKVFETLISLID